MTRRNLIVAVAAVVLAAAGCGPAKLNVERSFDLESGAYKAFDAPAQKVAQTVTVQVTSDKPVDVFALLNVTAEEAVDLSPEKAKAKAAGSKTRATSDTFTVAVPAGQGVAVWGGASDNGTRAKGTVKLTN